MKDGKQLDNRLPKLGAAGSLTKGEGLSAQVLVPDNVKPETTVSLRNAPEPAGEEGDVHAFRAHDTEASLFSGLADVRPANHVVFLHIVVTRPEETRLNFGDLMVKGLMEAVEAHKK